jgi:hypothetical protein
VTTGVRSGIGLIRSVGLKAVVESFVTYYENGASMELLLTSEERVEAWLETTKACRQKTESMIKACQEPVRAEIKTGLEEVKATGLEGTSEEMEAVVEHQEVPKGATHEEKIGALEDQYGDQLLAIRCHR